MFTRRFTKAVAKGSAAARLRQINRQDALQEVELSRLVQAYTTGEAVYLGRGAFWNWDLDGIPNWLVPQFIDLGLLGEDG